LLSATHLDALVATFSICCGHYSSRTFASCGRLVCRDLSFPHPPLLVRRAIQRYESGMKAVAKVAVSIPVETLKSLERVRTRLRKTRSRAVTEAIERWLRADDMGDDERRYVEGYLRQPERSDESAAVAGAVAASSSTWK
jgi:hypothetical protein